MAAHVLILNASWEFHAVVPPLRALKLLLRGKAEVVDDTEIVFAFRSEQKQIDVPIVMRLLRYVSVPIRTNRRWSNSAGSSSESLLHQKTPTGLPWVSKSKMHGVPTWLGRGPCLLRCRRIGKSA